VQPLIAYADHKKYQGISEPGFRDHTYDWRAAPGSPENTKSIQDHYTVSPLAAALERVYTSEAHLVSYVLHRDGEPLAHQPRLNKSSLDWLTSQGYDIRINTLFVDVDNPGHADNTELTIQTWASRIRSLLPGYGFYITPRGVRLIVLLDAWVDPERAEEMLETVFRHLEAVGIAPAEESRKCRDWTRHMKLPHYRSEKHHTQYISPIVEIDRLTAQHIEPTPIARRRTHRAARRDVASFTTSLPLGWTTRVERLAELLRCRYEGRRNDISLALAGALLGCQVVPETVPAIIAAVVTRAGWNDPRLHEANAVLTVGKWQDRQTITGLRFLQHIAPDVAQAVEAIGSATAEERAREENGRPAPSTLPVDVALEQIKSEIRNAYGLVVLRAQCGLGKSHTAREVAAERASVKPDAKRAPQQSRTGFSVPDHKLAQQHVDRLRADGVPVRRVFGVLSVVDADGKPVCHYAKQAKHIAGGQSIPRVFCEGNGRAPCDYRETCPAYGGVEGPEAARIVVGTHALLGQIDAEIGSTGLLVIDEPPDLLHTETFELGDLDTAITSLGMFAARYARAMAPALHVIRNWVVSTPDLAAMENNFARALSSRPPENVAAVALAEVDTDDPREAATLAFPEDQDPRIGFAPPLELSHLLRAREDEDIARQVGRASRVLRYIWNACQPGRVFSTRVEEYPAKLSADGSEIPAARVLFVTGPRTELSDALTSKHQHPVVVLDANADLHVPVYQRVVYAHETQQRPPKDIDALAPRFRYREFYAADGAPVERCMVMWGASRKAWFPDRRLTAESGALAALERTVRWTLERPELAQQVCIVTFKLLATALRAALGEPDAAERWHRPAPTGHGQPPEALPPLVERLRAILAALPGSVSVAHYGAIRGLDTWKSADALITLGDPVPELGGLRHDVAFIGLPDPDDRAHRMARAELEQAHGRLRTVHRRAPARALHIGRVLPGGWHGAEIRGRSRSEDWAKGGEMGKEHGIKGAKYGIKGAAYGILGKEHGVKGAQYGHLGAEFGHLGAEAGRLAEQPNRNRGDMTPGEVQVLVSMLGGNREACEALGISLSTLMRYKRGDRAIPQDLADRLRTCTSVPCSDPPAGGVSDGDIFSSDTPRSRGSEHATEDAAE
jgi:hypothetical protein